MYLFQPENSHTQCIYLWNKYENIMFQIMMAQYHHRKKFFCWDICMLGYIGGSEGEPRSALPP